MLRFGVTGWEKKPWSGLGKNARRHMATCGTDPCGELLAGKKCTSRSISGPQQHAYVILEYKHSLLQNTSKIYPKYRYEGEIVPMLLVLLEWMKPKEII